MGFKGIKFKSSLGSEFDEKIEEDMYWQKQVPSLYSELYKKEMENSGLEKETIPINSFNPDIGGKWQFYTNIGKHECIDKNICISAYNLLKAYHLEGHINNISYILKNGYAGLIYLKVHNNDVTNDLISIFENLEEDHDSVIFFKKSKSKKERNNNEKQIQINDKEIIQFLKKCLLRGILTQGVNIAKISSYYKGEFELEKTSNVIYFESIHNLKHYLSSLEEIKTSKISQSEMYELIYDLLHQSRLLPKGQIDDVQNSYDKHKYIRQSLSNFYKKYGIDTNYPVNYNIGDNDTVQNKWDKIFDGDTNSHYRSVKKKSEEEKLFEIFDKVEELRNKFFDS